jgi:hypothetical protein
MLNHPLAAHEFKKVAVALRVWPTTKQLKQSMKRSAEEISEGDDDDGDDDAGAAAGPAKKKQRTLAVAASASAVLQERKKESEATKATAIKAASAKAGGMMCLGNGAAGTSEVLIGPENEHKPGEWHPKYGTFKTIKPEWVGFLLMCISAMAMSMKAQLSLRKTGQRRPGKEPLLELFERGTGIDVTGAFPPGHTLDEVIENCKRLHRWMGSPLDRINLVNGMPDFNSVFGPYMLKFDSTNKKAVAVKNDNPPKEQPFEACESQEEFLKFFLNFGFSVVRALVSRSTYLGLGLLVGIRTQLCVRHTDLRLSANLVFKHRFGFQTQCVLSGTRL